MLSLFDWKQSRGLHFFLNIMGTLCSNLTACSWNCFYLGGIVVGCEAISCSATVTLTSERRKFGCWPYVTVCYKMRRQQWLSACVRCWPSWGPLRKLERISCSDHVSKRIVPPGSKIMGWLRGGGESICNLDCHWWNVLISEALVAIICEDPYLRSDL